MFNGNGAVAIPAVYDNLTPVRNGMIVAIKGGHWDSNLQSEHNQYPWVGGKHVLINTRNKVLIENFNVDEHIDFFSLVISQCSDKSAVRQNFKGVNGKYYSFLNLEKEFKAFLKNILTDNLTKAQLLALSYSEIYLSGSSQTRIKENRAVFTGKNFELIKSKLLELNAAKCDYSIFIEDLNPYLFSTQQMQKYFDNCGVSKTWIYPVMTIVVNHPQIGKDIVQDHFSFLRTDLGYKLIEVSMRSAKVY